MTDIIEISAALCAESYADILPAGFVDVGDLRYGVREVDGLTFIVLRGSANPHNWLRNVRAVPWRTCGGHIAHKGFIRAYQALCSGGMPTLKRQDLIITGHSLGGAIATLLAEHVGGTLITFGSPRVYFRFAPAPYIAHIRVTCDDDPVPLVPAIFYSHRIKPLVLRDADRHLIDAADHDIRIYRERLQK